LEQLLLCSRWGNYFEEQLVSFNTSAYKNLIPLILLSGLTQSFAHAQSTTAHPEWNDTRPDVMFTVGDSISAGFIASTHAVPGIPDGVKSLIPHQANTWSSAVKGSNLIGDNKDRYSWSSGQDIYSHYIYLRDYLKKTQVNELVVQNVAHTGAVVSGLAKQADEILDLANSGKYRTVKYITVFIGNNDACFDFPGGTPNDDFEKNLDGFFDKISKIDQDEKIRILVS
jgi:hypothetical protein